MADPEQELRDFLKFLFGPFEEATRLRHPSIRYATFAATHEILDDPEKVLVIKLNKILKFYDPWYVVPIEILTEVAECLWPDIVIPHMQHTLLCIVMREYIHNMTPEQGGWIYIFFLERNKDPLFAAAYLSAVNALKHPACPITKRVAGAIAFLMKIGVLSGIKELIPDPENIEKVNSFIFDEIKCWIRDSDSLKVDSIAAEEYNKMLVLNCYNMIYNNWTLVDDDPEMYQEIISSKPPHFTYSRIIPDYTRVEQTESEHSETQSESEYTRDSESDSEYSVDTNCLNNVLELSFDNICFSKMFPHSIKVNLYIIPVLISPKE